MDERTTHMVFVTAALAAVAAVLAGPAGARIPESGTQPADAMVVPYLSHGIGVDKTQWSGERRTGDRAMATAARQSDIGLDPAIQTAIQAHEDDVVAIPYLSQGQGVDASQFAGEGPQLTGRHAALVLNRTKTTPVAALPHGLRSEPLAGTSQSSEPQAIGLTGDSPLTRVVASEPEGLTGDSAATRYPKLVATATVTDGNEIDWTSFGAGAGMVALLGAGIGGVLLTTRRRHTVGLS